ncbi:MAG TPA: hypothetical protein VG407_01810 [Caulobacteraceae bacterium]|jgi:hypothetical protein|nr:hypothetical protein [Caulobacteraceae bacterium]
MSDQPNGPSWARRTQANDHNPATNPLRIFLIIAVCIAAPAIYFSVTHTGPHIRIGLPDFGGPNRHDAAVAMHAIEAKYDADAKNFNSEIKAAGPGQFLMPQALGARGGLDTATHALARQRSIIDKYEALFGQRKAEERKTVGALYANSNRQSAALAKFDQNSAQLSLQMNAYWSEQRGVIDEEGGIVAFLRRIRGSWRADGNRVLFLRPGLLQTYEKELSDLRGREATLSNLVYQMNFETSANRAALNAELGE